MSLSFSLRSGRLPALLLGAATIAALTFALSAPAQSRAADCDQELVGGAGSVWDFNGNGATFDDGYLPGQVGESVLGNSFNGFMGSYVNVDDKYESPNDDGCTFSRRNLSLSFPGVAGPTGIAVRPELHIDRKRPAGRQLVRLSNTTDHGVTFDFSWAGGFAIDDGDLKIDASSSGDKKVSKADGWITTCEDVGPAGCRKQGPIRSPELSVVWEGLAGRRDSADAVHLENDESPDFDLKFKNINLKPGRVTYLMTWVVLNRSAKSARKFAVQLAHEPDWAFAGISKSTRKLIRNW